MNKKPTDYKQYDKRWGSLPYNRKGYTGETIAQMGCGPTCAADLLSALVDPQITPVETCLWSVAHGWKLKPGNGTGYNYFIPQFQDYGVGCVEVNNVTLRDQPDDPAHDRARDYLRRGYWLVAYMGPGLWTSWGHFVVVWEWDDKVRICDPDSAAAKKNNGDPLTFRREVKRYWAVDARRYNGVEVSDLTDKDRAEIQKSIDAALAASAQGFERRLTEELGKIRLDFDRALAAARPVYGTIDDVPEWYKPSVRKLIDAGALRGTDPTGTVLNLSEDLCRMVTILDRMGALER